jgi:hypothetical protein
MYKAIISLVVLYGRFSYTKENILRVFENRVLTRISGDWRRLHNEELH